MGTRLGLHKVLCDLLASFNTWFWDPFNFETDNVIDAIKNEAKKHVYFQPPENMKLEYPCIIYERNSGTSDFADNIPYLHRIRYTVIVVDANPDSPIPGKVAELPTCVFDRHYTADNLNHDVYNLYF